MTWAAEPIQDGFFQELEGTLDLRSDFQSLWQSKDKAGRFDHRLRQGFEELVERCRLYEILKVEKRPWAVRLTLANMWRLTRLEDQPGLLFHTFDLVEGRWHEQDPEAITWRKREHGLRPPQASNSIWPDLEISYEANFMGGQAGPGLFENLMVAWLEKLRPALSGGIRPSLAPGEEGWFAVFIFRRLVNLPSSDPARAIDSALRRHIWRWDEPEARSSRVPLRHPPDIRNRLSRHLADQSADLARINQETPNFLPLLHFIPPAWWSRRDLLQDKVLRAAGPIFKNISPAGLRWLRRAPAETLSCFHHYFERDKDYFPKKYIPEAALLSTAGKVIEIMAGLGPQVAGQTELFEIVINRVWRLLRKLNGINPKPDPLLGDRLVRLLTRHIMAICTSLVNQDFVETEDISEALDAMMEDEEQDAILDWFEAEGLWQGLPDKNSTWLSLKRRSEIWHEEVWQREQAEEANAAWESLLEETVIDGLKIKPLVTGHDLYKEGREMRHCVSSYTWRCLNDGYRIFSLLEANGTRSTLSLRPKSCEDFVIDQHKGLANGRVSLAASKAAREVCRLYTLKHLEAAEAALADAAA